jgi:DNA-binding NtrC family response regulator
MVRAVIFKGETLSQRQVLGARSPALAPNLFLELECERPLEGPAQHRLAGVRRVRLGRGPHRLALVSGELLNLQAPDGWMSVGHAELTLGDGHWTVRDLGSKNGTFLNGARVEEGVLADRALLQLGRTFFRFRNEFRASNRSGVEPEELAAGPGGITTLSPRFADVLVAARAVAPTRVPVLLQGESGTGKEVLAQAIHSLSGRRGVFVAVNCGALPANLVESELFGHRKGAFSGADRDRPGLIRTADGGTLFLDEIGDLPLTAQAALLRVLQEFEIVPLGGARPEPLDLRVISATHRDLELMAQQGTFRHDLLARLQGVTLELTPLRDRPEDIPLLIRVVLRKLAPERPDVKLSPEAAQALLEHGWPLNVRELEKALAGGLALSGLGTIEAEHLPRNLREAGAEAPLPSLTSEEVKHREELVGQLQEHRGNLSAVARAVGKGRTQIVRWVSRYGIAPDAFKGR